MSEEWFILQFRPNAHNQANKNLNRQGFETFLPLYDITSQNLSRFVNASKPLFPGYMFIKFDRATSEWCKINNTYSVSRLITFNSILKSVPTKFVDNLKSRFDFSDKLLPTQKLKKGDQATSGIFRGFSHTNRFSRPVIKLLIISTSLRNPRILTENTTLF